jgi:hypothetical protein
MAEGTMNTDFSIIWRIGRWSSGAARLREEERAMFTLRGLLLVAHGACNAGKRRFLDLCGVDTDQLDERELDIVCAARNLPVPQSHEGYLLPGKYLGWLVDNKLWFDLSGGFSPAVQAELIKRLSDSSWYVRSAAATALASQKDLDPAVQAELIKRLSDSSCYVRSAAATALASQKDLDPAVQAELIKRLSDSSWYVRSAAATALASQKDFDLSGGFSPAVQAELARY